MCSSDLNELYIARERADIFLGLEIAKRIVLVILIWLFIPKGIMGLAMSWVVYTYFTLMVSLIFSQLLIRYSFIDFMRDASPYALISLASLSLSYFITKDINGNLLYIITNIATMLGSYLLLCKILKLEMIKEIEIWLFKKSNNE